MVSSLYETYSAAADYVVPDLVGIPDEEAYDYGLRLRELAQDKKFSSIQFIRLMDLMGLGDGEKISKSDYLDLVPTIRERLMSSEYFDQSFNIETELETNPDTKATFDAFFSRISEDLKWGKGLDAAVVADQAAYDAEVARVVKVMIQRLIVSNLAVSFVGILHANDLVKLKRRTRS